MEREGAEGGKGQRADFDPLYDVAKETQSPSFSRLRKVEVRFCRPTMSFVSVRISPISRAFYSDAKMVVKNTTDAPADLRKLGSSRDVQVAVGTRKAIACGTSKIKIRM